MSELADRIEASKHCDCFDEAFLPGMTPAERDKIVAALRLAAQPAAPVREPVAWRWKVSPMQINWQFSDAPPAKHPVYNLELLYAAPAPSAAQEFPFLAELLTTLNVMKAAYNRDGDRLMSVWIHDVQAVEAAIKALSQPHLGEQKPPSQTYATFGSDRVSMRSQKL